jgi:predicted HD superfamily hydrolase involved in NAD metabolism
MAVDREAYLNQLAQYLGAKRVRHSNNVADIAVELAQRFAPELVEKAELAGLLHDHAKRFSVAELTALAARLDIEMTAGEREQPELLHGKIGAALLRERFGVDDAQIAQAVADHVTGRPDMGLLSRILYVADQAAQDRDFPGIDVLRATAQQDLEQAVLLVVKHKLNYVMLKNCPIEEQSVALYNEMIAGLRGASSAKS